MRTFKCATESTIQLSPSTADAPATTATSTSTPLACSLSEIPFTDRQWGVAGFALATTPFAPSIGSVLCGVLEEVQQLREAVVDFAFALERLHAWAVMQEVAAERASNPVLH